MLRKIYLEGEIADKFGHEFDMNVSSFGEALQCLELNFSEFRQYLIECHEKGIGFICSVDDQPLNHEERLLLQYPKGSFTIQAVPAGSKGGIGKIFAAIAIIAVVYFTGGFGGTGIFANAAGTGLGFAGQLAVGLAINLAITGIQELMAPDPSVDTQQDESYLFQGSSQNIIEGDPVPILYGQLRIPGRPISFEIKNAERQFIDYIQTGQNSVVPPMDGGGGGGGGYGAPDAAPDFDWGKIHRTDLPTWSP